MKKNEIKNELVRGMKDINWFTNGDKLVDFDVIDNMIRAYVITRHIIYEFNFYPTGLVEHNMLINGIESTVYSDYSDTIQHLFERINKQC